MLEGLGVFQQVADLEFLAIEFGPALAALATVLVRHVGHGIGLHAGNEVVVLREQTGNDLARGVVCVGDEVLRLIDGGDSEENEHFVEQGAAIAVGPDHAFVDARGERQRRHSRTSNSTPQSQ